MSVELRIPLKDVLAMPGTEFTVQRNGDDEAIALSRAMRDDPDHTEWLEGYEVLCKPGSYKYWRSFIIYADDSGEYIQFDCGSTSSFLHHMHDICQMLGIYHEVF